MFACFLSDFDYRAAGGVGPSSSRPSFNITAQTGGRLRRPRHFPACRGRRPRRPADHTFSPGVCPGENTYKAKRQRALAPSSSCASWLRFPACAEKLLHSAPPPLRGGQARRDNCLRLSARDQGEPLGGNLFPPIVKATSPSSRSDRPGSSCRPRRSRPRSPRRGRRGPCSCPGASARRAACRRRRC